MDGRIRNHRGLRTKVHRGVEICNAMIDARLGRALACPMAQYDYLQSWHKRSGESDMAAPNASQADDQQALKHGISSRQEALQNSRTIRTALFRMMLATKNVLSPYNHRKSHATVFGIRNK